MANIFFLNLCFSNLLVLFKVRVVGIYRALVLSELQIQRFVTSYITFKELNIVL